MSSLRKNLIYNTLLSIAQIIFPIITFPYASRVLGPEAIGLVNFADSFCRYFILFAALGIPLYGVREISKVKDDLSKLAKTTIEIFLIHCLTTLVASFIFIFCVLSFHKLSENRDLYLWGWLMIFFNVFSTEWFFSGLSQFKYLTLRSITIRFFSIVLLFFFVKSKGDYLNYFLLNVFTIVVTGVVNIYYIITILKSSISFENLNFKKHLKPLILLFSTTVAVSVYVLFDTILLGFLANNNSVGMYSTAVRLIKLPIAVIGSMASVLLPSLVALSNEDSRENFLKLTQKSINFVLTFTIPLVAFVYLLAPEIIVLFSGPLFLNATLPLRIIAPIVLLIGLSNIFGVQVLTALSNDKYFTISVVIGMIVSLFLNLLLIPIMKENGTAISSLITELVVTAVTFYFARRVANISLSLRMLVKHLFLLVPFVLLILCVKAVLNSPFLIILVALAVTIPYYLFSQVYFFRNGLIIDIIKKVRQKFNSLEGV
jgi:O-antigen/teichoic acid export membrane protein